MSGSQAGGRGWDPAALCMMQGAIGHVLSAAHLVSGDLPLGFLLAGRCGHGSRGSDWGAALPPPPGFWELPSSHTGWSTYFISKCKIKIFLNENQIPRLWGAGGLRRLSVHLSISAHILVSGSRDAALCRAPTQQGVCAFPSLSLCPAPLVPTCSQMNES